ncbi:MAG: hypothetical protein ABIR32_17475 [Ilumatobacteraceae bacterium]
MTRAAHRLWRSAAGLLIGSAVAWQSWDASSLGEPSRRWAVIALLIVSVVGADLLPDNLVALPIAGHLTAVLIIALAAMYGCVPETDHFSVIALVLFTGLVIEMTTRRTMPLVWFAAAGGLVLWAGVYGATGRERALVGALFALWPPVLLGLVVRLASPVRVSSRLVCVAIVAVGGVATLVVSRTGALHNGIRPALESAAIAAVASAIVAVVLVRFTPLEHAQPS